MRLEFLNSLRKWIQDGFKKKNILHESSAYHLKYQDVGYCVHTIDLISTFECNIEYNYELELVLFMHAQANKSITYFFFPINKEMGANVNVFGVLLNNLTMHRQTKQTKSTGFFIIIKINQAYMWSVLLLNLNLKYR